MLCLHYVSVFMTHHCSYHHTQQKDADALARRDFYAEILLMQTVRDVASLLFVIIKLLLLLCHID